MNPVSIFIHRSVDAAPNWAEQRRVEHLTVSEFHVVRKGTEEGRSTVDIVLITFMSQDVEVTAKLIEGNFPNWRSAVPKKSNTAFSCGRKQLITAFQTCAIFADNKVPGLQLSGKAKEIEVSQPGKASAMVLGSELNRQPDITIRLNARYLIETLSVLESDDVRIQCMNADSPVMIEEGPVVVVINRLLAVT